ncbi:MAG: hypothetical protein IKU94_05570 [Bacteroidaceae bacterium]|nr:hypothetical protein [Bacteroidaceae bacterium]MBR5774891.1 hypothetical protein [Bacteroidaceae bacterium]
MKKIKLIVLLLLAAVAVKAQKQCWTINPETNAIEMILSDQTIPYSDHIEMSGEMVSFVTRWNIDEMKNFSQERSLVFPMLRTIPNNTHASLMYRMQTDIVSLLGVNGLAPVQLGVKKVSINGALQVVSQYGIGVVNTGAARKRAPSPVVEITYTGFPSTTLPMMCETYEVKNIASRPLTVAVPEFVQKAKTDPAKGVDGAYIIQAEIYGNGTYVIEPGKSITFGAAFQAYREKNEKAITPDVKAEYAKRMAYVKNSIDGSLVLETPEKVIDTEFRFAKIRASESIYRTKGGLMHGPGGESYYAAIWANDQSEYVNPLFPFMGYQIGNESSLNCYKHFARFMNDQYKLLPSSIIAEGLDTWGGAGDRGDAAMNAHGATRYLLARGSVEEAKELWPFIKWCLEYTRRQLNDAGVPRSDRDELEGRFPAGEANLCTATLYYDGLVSAAYLAPLVGEPKSVANTYRKQAEDLYKAINKYFSANVSGFETYRYYDGNTVLRSWICMPLCFGFKERAEGTLAALYSPKLLTVDGLLTAEGDVTFWDRSTLYALRGAYVAGAADQATKQLLDYSNRRLLGTHVPYPIEAWPEGSQRHLSAESGLYCRIITEGLFGIRPTGFNSFNLTIQLPTAWNEMALRHVKAFGGDFDIEVKRKSETQAEVFIKNAGKTKKYTVKIGQELKNVKI